MRSDGLFQDIFRHRIKKFVLSRKLVGERNQSDAIVNSWIYCAEYNYSVQ